MISYLKLGAKYLKYDRDGQTKWQCKDEISDTFEREEDAVNLCNENPSCRYIENIDCLGVHFKLCTYLESSTNSCVLQRTESQFENVPYLEYNVGGEATWECQDSLGVYRYFENAVTACNQNPICTYIENEDCSGTDGYEICNFLEPDGSSCAFEKKGN